MPAETPSPRSPERVLYVGANPGVTPLAEALSGGPGRFEVVVETDPQEALSRLETTDVDCVVSEYTLPGTDGVAFLRTVREPHPDLPFVLFPDAGSEAVASRAVSAGVTEYVRADADEEGVESLADRIRTVTHSPQPPSDHRYEGAQLSRFLEAFPDVVFVVDEVGRYLDVIASGSSSLLYNDPERLLGEQFHDVLPEATADRFIDVVREALDADEQQRIEYQLDVQSGSRWFEARVGPLSTGGQRRTVFWIARDVTERKRREQEYEQIFDGVNDAIAIHHGDTGEMLAVNRQMCELTGYDRDRVLELGAEGLLYDHPDQDYAPEEVPTLVARVLDGDDIGPYEQALETSDGEIRWVEVNPTRARIDGEQRFLAISRDITETRRKERDYEQIFNSVNDAIAVFDPDRNDFREVNEAYREMLGYDDIAAIRQRGIDGLSATDEGYTGERGWELVHEVAETGESVTVEWRVDTGAGDRLWLEATLTPAEIGGELAVLSIQRDVSDRKHREQRLEVFNRILRHNLRNKLDVIRSHAETLADRSANDDGHAEQIVSATDELATLGARARNTDRIMSVNEGVTEVSLVELLDEVIELSGVNQRGPDVTTDLPGSAELTTNRDALVTAVRSALENAIEHTDSEVAVTVENTPKGYSIAVEDDGPGISRERLVPIETGTETDLTHGRGLGLWQLRWGVDKLNGELSFDTDAGTTVRITVPDRSTPDGER